MKHISLQTAKELHEVAKEKGLELPEADMMYIHDLHSYEDIDLVPTREITGTDTFEGEAYDTNELLEMLPRGRVQRRWNDCKGFMQNRYVSDILGASKTFYADTPQEALAKLLIYLIKNNLYNDTTN